MPIVNLISHPVTGQPNPIENCLQFCFDFSDSLQTRGTIAYISFSFYDNSPQANGETFIFAGIEFEVSNIPSPLGGRYIDLTSNLASENADNFKVAIEHHPFFSGNVSISLQQFSPTQIFMVASWVHNGEQSNFYIDFNNLSHPFADAMITNGTFPLYGGDAFKFGYKIMLGNQTIIDLQQCPMAYDADGNILPLCLDLHYELTRLLQTTTPDCWAGVIEDETIQQLITLHYGAIQAKTGTCGVDFVGWDILENIPIINGAWNVEDGFMQIWYDNYAYNLYNLGGVRFLTSRPSGFTLCDCRCDWLWIVLNYKREDNPIGMQHYEVKVYYYDSNGTIVTVQTKEIEDDGVYIIPSGPGNVTNVSEEDIDMANVYYYEVVVFLSPDPFSMSVPYSERHRVYIDRSCCEDVGVYFLDTKGGYTFLPMDYVEEITYTSEFTEICRDVPCGGSYRNMLGGSRFNTDSNLQTTISLRSRKYQKTAELRNLFKAFKASENRFVMYKGRPRRMLANSDSTRIFQHGEYIEVITTLKDAQEFKVQTEY